MSRLSTTVSPRCNGPRLKRLAQSRCSTCFVIPIDTPTKSRNGDHVPKPWRSSSRLPVCRTMLDCNIHLIRVSWTGRIRKWRLSSRDISSEWRKTVEERGGGESRTEDFCAANVAGAELPEREVVDMMTTLLCSFDGMESKIDNGHCFGPATVSSRKKKSHAESTQINHPSAARSSETRLQMSGKMLDAIEEVCLFCAMCFVRVGRVIRAAEDGDSSNATVFTGLPQMAASKQHSRQPPHVARGSPSISHAVLYRSVLIVQAVKRVHQPVHRPVQKPTWRPHISSPIIGLGLLRAFLNKSTVRWLPLASFTHFTVVLQILHGAYTCWPPPRTRTLVAPPPLVLLRHTAVSTSGDPTLSCEPRVGIHRMASLSGVAPAPSLMPHSGGAS